MNQFLKKTGFLKKARGFTLIEILIVIGIIAILASIVIIAINPAKQFAQARNTQREAGANSVLNAIGQRLADNKGVFAGQFTINSIQYTCGVLPTIATNATPTAHISNAGTLTDDTITSSDLGCLVPTYIASLPVDPSGPTLPDTDYTVGADPTGRITVCAPQAATETALPSPAAICVTR